MKQADLDIQFFKKEYYSVLNEFHDQCSSITQNTVVPTKSDSDVVLFLHYC